MEIYQNIIIERNIIIESKFINKNLEDNILNKLKNQIEEKCIPEGYVQKDSTAIVKRSIGTILTNSFKADVSYHIYASVNVCFPVKDMVIKAQVFVMNKAGIWCKNGPLAICIPKKNLLTVPDLKLNIGDSIKIKVCEKLFKLYDKEIRVIGNLYNESENKQKDRKIIEEKFKEEEEMKASDDINEDDDISIGSLADLDETESLNGDVPVEENSVINEFEEQDKIVKDLKNFVGNEEAEEAEEEEEDEEEDEDEGEDIEDELVDEEDEEEDF